MAVIGLRPPIVDGLDIVVAIGSSKLLKYAQEQLYAMLKAQKEIFPNGKITLTSKSAGVHIHLYPGGVRKIASIQAAMTEGAYKYLRLALLPSQFVGLDFDCLQQVIANWLSYFNYKSLYYNGNVSRLDIAIDDVLHPAHSFLPFRPICNVSAIYTDWLGQKGATYLGGKTSDLQYCIYDKTRQLIQTGGVPQFNTHVRFEARLRHLGFPPSQVIQNVKMPFTRLEIISLQAASSASSNQEWKDFLALCSSVGSCKALSFLHSKHLRKQYIKRLREAPVSWWQPQKVWGKFPEAFQKLQPTVTA